MTSLPIFSVKTPDRIMQIVYIGTFLRVSEPFKKLRYDAGWPPKAGENESGTTNQNTRRKEAAAQEKTSCGELQRADIAYKPSAYNHPAMR
jgi:hypothetical protein